MSKPVTNVEIEDVLSSIRRLVANSDRVERGGEGDAGAGPEAGPLVLTETFRVDAAGDHIAPPKTAAPDPQVDGARAGDTEPEGAEDVRAPVSEAGATDPAPKAEPEALTEELAAGEAPATKAGRSGPLLHGMEGAGRDREPTSEAGAAELASVLAKLARKEPETPVQVRDDGMASGAGAGPDAAADPDSAAGPADGDADVVPKAAMFDEEMLRDLVGEIVRQELQGALGERITRNVRKLVRREIHRALASQQLD